MSTYSKKLHYRKSGTIYNIELGTSPSDVGGNYITLRDGASIVYAKLGATSDSLASDMRVRKGGNIYAVIKTLSAPSGSISYTIPGTYSFTVPQGYTSVYVQAIGGGGGGGSGNVGCSGKNGLAGGTTSFGSLLTCVGGMGGTWVDAAKSRDSTVTLGKAGATGYNGYGNGGNGGTGNKEFIGGVGLVFSPGGNGGGAGTYKNVDVSVTPGQVITITIGAGGAGGFNISSADSGTAGTGGFMTISWGS